MNQENFEHCKSIRERLEGYYNGEYYQCPECGEIVHIPDLDDTKLDECFRLPCGCAIEDYDDLYSLSVYSFFDDRFDTIYYFGEDGDMRGVRILIAFGGPNIYVDTYRKTVELFWWTETATVDLEQELCEDITEIFEDMYKACH